MAKLTHTDIDGAARMVDVGRKKLTKRIAEASTTVKMNAKTFAVLQQNRAAKGDVLAAAKLAGIHAAKRTSELIPLCHQIPLDSIEITFVSHDAKSCLEIRSRVECTARTGVEMEALTACAVAALTTYDMLKAVQKDIVITDLVLRSKKGGRSGAYLRMHP